MAFRTRTLVVLLLAGMMVQISCVQVYRVLFAMNRKAIAERLCEKRTRSCDGKCFLQKKVAAAHDETEHSADKTPATKSPADPPETMPGMEADRLRFGSLIQSQNMPCPTGGLMLPEGHEQPIDHPPDSFLHIFSA